MPKKKRTTLIIAIISVVLLIIIGIMVYLYLTTDMFKSNESLFVKYLGKAAQNFETVFTDKPGEEYQKLLDNNKYLSNAELTANYSEKINTTEESTSNVINTLKLNMNGQTDKLNNLYYTNLALQKNNENLMQIEFLRADTKYGIRFSDLIKQYLVIENSNLNELASKMGMNGNIPDQIPEIDMQTMFKLSEEELADINTRYVNQVTKDFVAKDFSSANKVNVTISNNNFTTNAYTITTNKEQLNNTYVNILEELKQDEIILSRADNIDSLLAFFNQTNGTNNTTTETEQNSATTSEENETVHEQIVNKIDKTIRDIQNKNIGTDEAKITVYETKGETIRTTIETQEYKIMLDTVVASDKTYIQISYEKYGNTEDSQTITIVKKENEITINTKQVKNENTTTSEFKDVRTIKENKENQEITFSYTIGSNKININLKENKEIVNSFSETPEFSGNNYVLLNNLNESDLKSTMSIVNDKIAEKQKTINEQINMDEISNMLVGLGVLKEKINITQLPTFTNTEIKKFNAQFELFQGEEVESSTIKELMDIVKDNLATVEKISDQQIKLNITKGQKNEELANKVVEIVTDSANKSKKYTVKMEYDENTEIIKDILITTKK